MWTGCCNCQLNKTSRNLKKKLQNIKLNKHSNQIKGYEVNEVKENSNELIIDANDCPTNGFYHHHHQLPLQRQTRHSLPSVTLPKNSSTLNTGIMDRKLNQRPSLQNELALCEPHPIAEQLAEKDAKAHKDNKRDQYTEHSSTDDDDNNINECAVEQRSNSVDAKLKIDSMNDENLNQGSKKSRFNLLRLKGKHVTERQKSVDESKRSTKSIGPRLSFNFKLPTRTASPQNATKSSTTDNVINSSTANTTVEIQEDVNSDASNDSLGQLPAPSVVQLKRVNNYTKSPLDTFLVHQEHKQQKHQYPPHHQAHQLRQTGRVSNLRRGSLCIFSQIDEQIVTPFAQVLASLRKVRSNFMQLTNVVSTRDTRFGTVQGLTSETDSSPLYHGTTKPSAAETLEELEWCLERLENIQTHRSVSDMASSKFKKMLNKELSQFADNGRTGRQISEYICSTFLDSKETDTISPTNATTTNNSDNTDSNISGTGDLLTMSADVNKMSHDSSNVNLNSGALITKPDPSPMAVTDPTSNVSLMTTTKSIVNFPTPVSTTSSTGMLAPTSLTASSRTATAIPPGGTAIPASSKIELVNWQVNEDSVKHKLEGRGDAENQSSMDDELNFQLNLKNLFISTNPEKLDEMMHTSVDRWGIDIFDLSVIISSPLTCIFYTIVQKRKLLRRFNIPEENLLRYMYAVESKYNENPYHNRIHAADVVQSTHVLLTAQSLDSVFTDLEIFAVLFACAVHDVGHPGVTNQYLINTNDKLAILYNDSSVLENHHLAIAFSLLSESGCDVFVNFTRKQRLTLRRMIIDMVLATDMSKHMSLLADLKTMVETKKVAGSGILTLENYTDRMQILQNMIHCADLSNPTKPLELYRQWTNRIMEEHFRQGDKERELGLDISPICDRNAATIEKSQVSFIDYIVYPLWETWSDLVYPDAQTILETLKENREWYQDQIDEDCQEKQTNDE